MPPEKFSPGFLLQNPDKPRKDKSKTQFISRKDPDHYKNYKINPKTGKPDPNMPKTGIEEN
jgi:hypothetical protein